MDATYALHDQSPIAGLIVVVGRGRQWAVGRSTAAVTQGRCRVGVLGDGSQAGPIWEFGSERNENQKAKNKSKTKKGRQIVVDNGYGHGNEMGVAVDAEVEVEGCRWAGG